MALFKLAGFAYFSFGANAGLFAHPLNALR